MPRALFIPPVRAAFAVRTFALVATFMPRYPAATENTAPIRKQTAVFQLMNTAIRTNSTTTKITSILYSANRNALAPSLMLLAISFMRSVPASALETFTVLMPANISAITARTGASQIRFSTCDSLLKYFSDQQISKPFQCVQGQTKKTGLDAGISYTICGDIANTKSNKRL